MPSFIPLRRWEPPLPTDKDGRMQATENDQTNIMQKPATGIGSNLVHKPLMTCFTTVPSFIPLHRREPPLRMDEHGGMYATENDQRS